MFAQIRTAVNYDVIFIGAGTATSIVASHLVSKFPQMQFLILEYGGPTSEAVGGTDYPPYFADAEQKETIFDVPGEYSNIAFHPKGVRYQLPMTSFTYQGMGFGGNSQYNGMLFQIPPDAWFDEQWPEGWRAADLRPYFQQLEAAISITQSPSTDGKTYNNGAASIADEVYDSYNIPKVVPKDMGGHGNSFHGRPAVAVDKGQRGGPIQSYLTKIVDEQGKPSQPNLQIVQFAEVTQLNWDTKQPDRIASVTYLVRSSLTAAATTEVIATLSPNGRVIMGAGALNSARVLLLSGIGPQKKHAAIFPPESGKPAVPPFHINNAGIGSGLFDHIGTGLAFEYTGAIDYKAYDYADYQSNAADLQQYVADRSGPYAQYGPVSVLETFVGSHPEKDETNLELFLNPNGIGDPDNPFYTSASFSVYAMLLSPEATTNITLKNGEVQYPNLYLSNANDLDTMVTAIQRTINMFTIDPVTGMPRSDIQILFGPGKAPFEHLDPYKREDIETFVSEWDPVTETGFNPIYFTRLIMNHWGGTAPLSAEGVGISSKNLLVNGTQNIHVIDASAIPANVPCHPVGTIMALALKAADVLAAELAILPPNEQP